MYACYSLFTFYIVREYANSPKALSDCYSAMPSHHHYRMKLFFNVKLYFHIYNCGNIICMKTDKIM